MDYAVAWLSEAEIELIEWYRSLNTWEVAAITYWLMTGDTSQVIKIFSPRYQAVA